MSDEQNPECHPNEYTCTTTTSRPTSPYEGEKYRSKSHKPMRVYQVKFTVIRTDNKMNITINNEMTTVAMDALSAAKKIKNHVENLLGDQFDQVEEVVIFTDLDLV